MSTKGWIAAAVATTVVVVGAAGTGVAYQRAYGNLDHGQPFQLEEPTAVVTPVEPQPLLDASGLNTQLAEIASSPSLGTFGAYVRATDGTEVFAQSPTKALTPASSTKILTAAAAILELGPQDRITTSVYATDQPGTLVLKATGDVWLTEEKLAELADQIVANAPGASTLLVDTSAWSGPTILDGWDPVDIDAGYVAPLEPVMINGARIGATEGDVPRSHTPAYDVAHNLAMRIGAGNVAVGKAAATGEVASVESPTLIERLNEMMVHSDNVMAEAIGREVALHRGLPGDVGGSTQATLDTLREHGFDTTGITLADNSGLSVHNRITPELLEEILFHAATDAPLRTLLTTLPVAAGSGTLEHRFADATGKGWVRAKTGTLDHTSALAGIVTGKSGVTYTFAFLANDADVAASRSVLDALASALRDA
ncbi:D-alanyl-D-alanine carboxypeptidase [Corynebacterium renale]|uniref:D-alanyl-D-alanine carboxypeptidase/D-alanyl-D-alanine-endopeptidase (Penicillin-binding protein 4) n=1 Tax=Corynebacterium renale TaxID=1724 RepID=A0A2A9DP82_9CORY|nr:D-alanyl-D-alanine carboxypeptidase/D-alanyl-D-alanine-endopeptidase [Corynebacterium renale]PFG27985.1 D-alanyl-D-alanine carboxypeptidase/D-alanyl-D-alanine-endopeptidase (penicillin-binding protein 4) [Corynebacterium renale]SQG63292.1 D-alanyl-D-alanine carboxypeptidase [Corynebacterium renale]SQI21491.1 D-alanyl-D-alanine carboxypeptidase [Corynebacterium renale]STC99379.1 D-alanyl-D-alanine carboxypeptidase [Corynebacterium renale]